SGREFRPGTPCIASLEELTGESVDASQQVGGVAWVRSNGGEDAVSEAVIRTGKRVCTVIAAQNALRFHAGEDAYGIWTGENYNGIGGCFLRRHASPGLAGVGSLPQARGRRRIQRTRIRRVLRDLLGSATGIGNALQFNPRPTGILTAIDSRARTRKNAPRI